MPSKQLTSFILSLVLNMDKLYANTQQASSAEIRFIKLQINLMKTAYSRKVKVALKVL